MIKDLPPRTAVVGVGNPLRGDDGCGVLVSEKLKEKGAELSFSCGQVPENYLGKIASHNPEFILIVDAVDFGGRPGEIKYFKGKEVFRGLSTHTGGLDLVAGFLETSTGASVVVAGIQPEKLNGKMTETVRKAALCFSEKLAKLLCTNQ